jgi:hypothetical protein
VTLSCDPTTLRRAMTTSLPNTRKNRFKGCEEWRAKQRVTEGTASA